METRAKVWIPTEDGGKVPFVGQERFYRETVAGVERLVVSAGGGWCGLMLDLLGSDGGEYSCVYEQRDVEEGQTPSGLLSFARLAEIVDEFREFLETDPRHNFWVLDAKANKQIVLDEHNWLFVYGGLDATEASLCARGFGRGPVDIPSPHLHFYEPDDGSEARLISAIVGSGNP